MEGKKLGFLKGCGSVGGLSLKEQIVRKTWRNVRKQGHIYVDLRDGGKRSIFFCTLCLAPCYNDNVLFDHLSGNFHKKRYEQSKVTLLGPKNPWPFDDGVLFFGVGDEGEEDAKGSGNGTGRFLCGKGDAGELGNLAMVVHGDAAGKNGSKDASGGPDVGSYGDDKDDIGYEDDGSMVIPGVIREGVADLRVRLIGRGQISAIISEMKDGVPAVVRKIWCEWLGRDEANVTLPVSEFGIVTLAYYYELGKEGVSQYVRSLPPPAENSDDTKEMCANMKRKSFSEPEDVSDSLSKELDSSVEDYQASSTATSGMTPGPYDDEQLQSRIMPSKKQRRELRRQQRLASKRMCGICQQKMLPGKDVATFVNMKTKRLACSRRNVHGAFHVYHASCLIHWLMLCEYEILTNPPPSSEKRRRSRKKAKGNESGNQLDAGKAFPKGKQKKGGDQVVKLSKQICSVFCPECQGTCMVIEEDELENPTFGLSEMFKYKIKLGDVRRAWMKSPEELPNCSIGLVFPSETDDPQAKTSAMKLLHFYRSEEGFNGLSFSVNSPPV
ncbi:hypothetical protein Droror1_Dr00003939 [Drosera rotundifolia]